MSSDEEQLFEEAYGFWGMDGVFANKKHSRKEPESLHQTKSSLGFNFVSGGIETERAKEQQQRSQHEYDRKHHHKHHRIGVHKDRGYAKWTKSEKRDKFGGLSFAERYLKKHGFKGRLGAESQGIANPVKHSTKRKNNEGLGFNNMDEQQNQPKNIQERLQEMEMKNIKEKQYIKETQKLWKIIDETSEYKEYKQQRKKRKIMRKKAEEIHDYTNPTKHIDICPEFRCNVERICDLIEERKEILHRERENVKQRKHGLELQLNALTKQKCTNEERKSTLYGLKALMNRLDTTDIDIDTISDVFDQVKSKFYAEYVKYRLWRVFKSIIFANMDDIDIDGLIVIMMKWKDWINIEDVIVNKIRKKMYEWDPMQIDVDIVELFKSKLKNVLSISCYKTLLNNLIIPRLNHIFEAHDIDNEIMIECIVQWDFVFTSHDIDDILSKNITKEIKSFCRGFEGRNMEQHMRCIDTLKHWKSVLINMGLYGYILDKFVMKKLKHILGDCVRNVDMNMKLWNAVHLWFVHDMLSCEEYIKLLRHGFFEEWLLQIYERLNMNVYDDDCNCVENVEFIWNNMFAVIKNHIFGTEHKEINDLINDEMIEQYLKCGLDMIHFVVTNEKQTLPSFEIIRDRKKNKKKNSKEENKNENQYVDTNRDRSISILELIEMTAENHGIEFCLCRNQKFDGKKMYKFGKSFICFYDKSIFLKKRQEWSPVDIQDLLRLQLS